MKALTIELKKEKRTGVVILLPIVGVLGALYGLANFTIRKESLLHLPLPPMDILLTQLYGMIVVLNLFALIVATCIIYNMEFKGAAIKKMYTLPINVSHIYSSKFIILTTSLFIAVGIQNLALAYIGMTELPPGSFDLLTLLLFAGYSFITAMPVLSFMILIASRFENMWTSLGIGVAGFLSSMALVKANYKALLVHPFIIMLKPAVAMQSTPEGLVVGFAAVETILFLLIGLWLVKHKNYE